MKKLEFNVSIFVVFCGFFRFLSWFSLPSVAFFALFLFVGVFCVYGVCALGVFLLCFAMLATLMFQNSPSDISYLLFCALVFGDGCNIHCMGYPILRAPYVVICTFGPFGCVYG